MIVLLYADDAFVFGTDEKDFQNNFQIDKFFNTP